MIEPQPIRSSVGAAFVVAATACLFFAAAPAQADLMFDAPGLTGEPARLTETDAVAETVEDEESELPVVDQAATSSDADEAPASAAPMPVAPDIDLSEPVVMPENVPPVVAPPEQATPEAAAEPTVVAPAPPPAPTPAEPDRSVVPAEMEAPEEPAREPLVLLGEEVAPGTSARLSWSPDQHFDGIAVPTPVLVVNGAKNGKTLCLTAAVDGDELYGIEFVRRVLYGLDPETLSGAVIGVPIVNLQGFRRSSRYLPDRRDLNRFFPGNPNGSSASRIADSFFREVVRHCDALVDVHTGSFLRTNLPQLRADMTQPEVAALTKGFGATAVLHSPGTRGTLRRAATDAGIPAVTLETGEPSRLQTEEIEHGTKGIQTLLNELELVRRVRIWGDPEPVYYQSTWVRASRGGLLFGNVKLGQRVRKGALLGTITDPITNVSSELRAPVKGRILGMALNQVVLPGFAAYRIGIPSSDEEIAGPPPEPELPESLEEADALTDIDSEEENSE